MTHEVPSQGNLTRDFKRNEVSFRFVRSAPKANNPGLQNHGQRLTKRLPCCCRAAVCGDSQANCACALLLLRRCENTYAFGAPPSWFRPKFLALGQSSRLARGPSRSDVPAGSGTNRRRFPDLPCTRHQRSFAGFGACREGGASGVASPKETARRGCGSVLVQNLHQPGGPGSRTKSASCLAR